MTERDVLVLRTTIRLSWADRLRVLLRGVLWHRIEVAMADVVPPHHVTDDEVWAAPIFPRRSRAGRAMELARTPQALLLLVLLVVAGVGLAGCGGAQTTGSGRALVTIRAIWQLGYEAPDRGVAAWLRTLCNEGDSPADCERQQRWVTQIPFGPDEDGDGQADRVTSLGEIMRAHRSAMAAAVGAVAAIEAAQEDGQPTAQRWLRAASCGTGSVLELTRVLTHLRVPLSDGFRQVLGLLQNFGRVGRGFILGRCPGWDDIRSSDPPPQTGEEPNPGGTAGDRPAEGAGSGPAARIDRDYPERS